MINKISVAAAVATVAAILAASAPAHAAFLYSSGPVNGSIEGYTISAPYSVTDSFTLTTDDQLNTALFYSFEIAGDHETSVDWAITSSSFGPVIASGVADPHTGLVFPAGQFDAGQIGPGNYDIDSNTFSLPSVDLLAGTYWLQLSGVTDTGGVSYWDRNNGKGSAADSALGSIPVESFNLYGGAYVPTPETSTSIGLLLGVAALAAFGMVSASRRSKLAA